MFPSQDVVKLILKDHRIAEDLLRQLRHGGPSGRRHALREFVRLYVAHVRAEEAEVYPALKRCAGIDDDQIQRGLDHHDEGIEALLDLLEADERSPCAWDARLDELVAAVTDYADETERTLLADARERVTPAGRTRLGAAFARERAEQLRACRGDMDDVRRMAHG
ncbi:hemerythrin domain-containing protein [Streptomyces sp. NPDC050703]|uniref:hemerythrin domain-containing protein n=1 Tax=Streptomyces sp. NPDC050703 TaxID=3157218 RepID=UPI00341C8045